LRKLNSIIIKKVEFENTPVNSAINYLIAESREADPTHEGVNIIPAFDTGARTVAPPPPEAGAPEAATSAPPESYGARSVTLSLRNIPLVNAIKFLTTVTGLKYRVESDAVLIVSSEGGGVEGPTQTRTFVVPPTFFQSGSAGSSGGGGGFSSAGGGGGGFVGVGGGGASSGSGIGGAAVDAKKEFESYGINFPAGTSVTYNSRLGILVVKHSADGLDQIEEIVQSLDKTPVQVQIETKFLEVRQSELEELGFRWAMGPASQNTIVTETGAGTEFGSLPIGGFYRGIGNSLSGGQRQAAAVQVSALDALLSGSGGTGLVAAGAETVLTVTGFLTDPAFQVMIDALAQKGLTNLLSAPRVTTTSGESAKILITREFIFPSAYTDPQVSTGTSSTGGTGAVGIVGPSPSAFTTREIGVILDVKPQVSSDKYTINLTLAPEVVDFEGFVNYEIFALAGDEQFTFLIQQPVFNKRTLNTSVYIWDGQTVTLGGLIREDQIKINDKIPILGDIPFFGRLFQSKIDSNTKRNLVIFLTARIVDPAGNPTRKFEEVRITNPAGETD
jgi:general secretion pathway protein D